MAIRTDSIPPYRPRDERESEPAPSMREIGCRRCGRWMTHGADFRWHHTDDDTLACVDPDTLEPYENVELDGTNEGSTATGIAPTVP